MPHMWIRNEVSLCVERHTMESADVSMSLFDGTTMESDDVTSDDTTMECDDVLEILCCIYVIISLLLLSFILYSLYAQVPWNFLYACYVK